jgi:hypothetical protein
LARSFSLKLKAGIPPPPKHRDTKFRNGYFSGYIFLSANSLSMDDKLRSFGSFAYIRRENK